MSETYRECDILGRDVPQARGWIEAVVPRCPECARKDREYEELKRDRDCCLAECERLRKLCGEAAEALYDECSTCVSVDHSEQACCDCARRVELAKRLRAAEKGGA